MRYERMEKAVFESRPNRFIAHVRRGGETLVCHVKNTGRCRELLVPGTAVYIQKSDNPARKTAYDLISVYKPGTDGRPGQLVNMDSQAPNVIVKELLEQGRLIGGVKLIRPETKYGNSRFDFYAETETDKWFIEVKGVTLEEDGIARFPDAPTERGVRHMQELMACMADGYRAMICFVIQMKGVQVLEANAAMHPAFAETLAAAARAGVEVRAFDCLVTADSLTAGHFMALTLMKRLQMAGNKPVALIGGGTTMIGDPSGRTDMRKMLTREDIEHNAACFKKQMERFIDFSDGKALMVNNADWLLDLNYVDLLREVGACFSVNNMLRAECYKQRMEKGLSFLEFNYMIMQSYDFYVLYQKYGCNMQFGGDDQWSNMLGGTELIRRKLGKDAYAMTITLLTDSQGKKMGKTAGNAVWLDPNKTSPYDFFQYWRNVDDADVIKCMNMLTFMPLEEIAEYAKLTGSDLNRAKEKLAYELTELVHGKEEAEKALTAARAVFANGGVSANMPSTVLTEENFTDGKISAIDLLVLSKLAPSRGEARRLIQQGGMLAGDEKVEAIDKAFDKTAFEGDGLVVKKGKKTFHRFTL